MRKSSSIFKNGKFHNINHTPQFTEGYSMWKVMQDFLLSKTPDKTPVKIIPSIKTSLLDLDIEDDVLIWFGHSSYFIQIENIRFLVDPVFSGNASPIPNSMKSFKGTDIYSVDEMPIIDYLIITHDHYDHFDHKTISALNGKVHKVICPLGVANHLKSRGYNGSQIIENDWYQSISLRKNLHLHTLPSRHFSGRSLIRNNTLWCSYLLETPSSSIYMGGDSGYDNHFEEIGSQFGKIDLVILENGQYNNAWRYIHMHPEEVLKAARDLKAVRLFPVHSGKFALAQHPWYEPLNSISELNQSVHTPMITPQIGEKVDLKNKNQIFEQWWKKIM